MLEKITFTNHMNESINFGEDGIFVNSSDVHDYSWEVTSYNNKINAFSKGVVTKSLPVIIACSSEEEGIEKRNRLMEVAEKDVLAKKRGRLVVNDYYMDCYITASKKEQYLKYKQFMQATLTVVTDYPSWISETTYTFGGVADPDASGHNFDYNYDFPYDYMSAMMSQTVKNPYFTDSNFRLVIYGPTLNPAVVINGHVYNVNVTIEAGEYLVIDSMRKTITLYKNGDVQVNCFDKRNRNSYIFEKIAIGSVPVSWEGNFVFDVVLLEERSEPKWI